MTQTLTTKDKVLHTIQEQQPISTGSLRAAFKESISSSYLAVVLANLKKESKISKNADGLWVAGHSSIPVGYQHLALNRSVICRGILTLEPEFLPAFRDLIWDKFDYGRTVAKMYELYLLLQVIDKQPLDTIDPNLRSQLPPVTNTEFMSALEKLFANSK